MQITPYVDRRFDEVLDFINRLNDSRPTHIGYFGTGRDEIAHELNQLVIPMTSGFRLAEEDGCLAGVFGVDADPEVGRAWLLGPLVDHPRWQQTADALFVAVQAAIPAGIRQQELFGDSENRNLAHFALRHGFDARSETYLLTAGREGAPPVAPAGVIPFQPDLADQFVALHETIFPNTYYTAQQLIDKHDEQNRLLLHVRGGRLLGYAFQQLMPDAGQAYLDFIGVVESARGMGVGRRLLAAVLHEAFALPEVSRLNLTVNSDNSAALGLYRAFGFEVERAMRGYRKDLASVPSASVPSATGLSESESPANVVVTMPGSSA